MHRRTSTHHIYTHKKRKTIKPEVNKQDDSFLPLDLMWIFGSIYVYMASLYLETMQIHPPPPTHTHKVNTRNTRQLKIDFNGVVVSKRVFVCILMFRLGNTFHLVQVFFFCAHNKEKSFPCGTWNKSSIVYQFFQDFIIASCHLHNANFMAAPPHWGITPSCFSKTPALTRSPFHTLPTCWLNAELHVAAGNCWTFGQWCCWLEMWRRWNVGVES